MFVILMLTSHSQHVQITYGSITDYYYVYKPCGCKGAVAHVWSAVQICTHRKDFSSRDALTEQTSLLPVGVTSSTEA